MRREVATQIAPFALDPLGVVRCSRRNTNQDSSTLSQPRNVSPSTPEFLIQSDDFAGAIAFAVAIGFATLMPDKMPPNVCEVTSLCCAQEHLRQCNRTAVVFDTNNPCHLSSSIRHQLAFSSSLTRRQFVFNLSIRFQLVNLSIRFQFVRRDSRRS